MTGELWTCGQCGRTVNRFVNGTKCPECGARAGSKGGGFMPTV